MQVFNISGVAVSGFFIIFILSRRNLKKTDFLLVLINLLMISFLVLDVLVPDHITVNRFFLQAQLPFYTYPVFILFAMETLQKKIHMSWLLLFIPAVITTVCIGYDLYFFHDYDSQKLLVGVYNDPPFFYHVLYKGNQVFFITALVWLIRRIKVYEREIKDSFSFTDPIELNWLMHFSFIYLAVTIISLSTFLISNFKLLPISAQFAYSVVSTCRVLAIFYLSFHGIRQYTIAEYYGKQKIGPVSNAILPAPAGALDQKEKYKTSSLTRGELETIYRQLLSLFESQAVYLESKLQLLDVAEKLKVTPHTLSQTINTMTGKPFYDFVNGYRVKTLQGLLEDQTKKRFTILALGLDSGFNSKASLNRVFKEHTGLSPSEYQRDHLRN